MASTVGKFERQATLSVICAIVGGLAAVGACGLVARNLHWSQLTVPYKASGLFFPILVGATVVGLAAAAAGVAYGFNSASQKRNTKTRLSWVGFFLNAGVIALALMNTIFFLITRDPLKIG